MTKLQSSHPSRAAENRFDIELGRRNETIPLLQQSVDVIEIVHTPIDTSAVLQSVESPNAGAAILFIGTTRAMTKGRGTDSLDYECHESMALKSLNALADEAKNRWTLERIAIVHRVGHLEILEASVAIAVSSPHRKEAFEAGQWLIDTLKERVPIWKKENWSDGTHEWVHPGMNDK